MSYQLFIHSGNKFFIRYMYIYIANISSSVTCLFPFLNIPFDEQVYFHNVSFIKFFSFIVIAFCVLSQILLPTSKSQKFSCKFVLPFTFRSLIHLKLIFVYWVKWFIFPPYGYPIVPALFVENILLSSLNCALLENQLSM